MKIDVASITANLSRDLSRIIDARLSADDGDAATVVREWCAAVDDATAVKAVEVLLVHCVGQARHLVREAASGSSESDDAKEVLAAIASGVREIMRDEMLAEWAAPALSAQFPQIAERLSGAGRTNNESERKL